MNTTDHALPNPDHDHHHSTNITTTTTTITAPKSPVKLINATKTKPTKANPLPCKLKCARMKRCVGKKDRQSKIHTAQGLRDRRMRLSVHTARKFFDLNDMLGFDKASKTIEWLFSKSHKAILEAAETLQSGGAASTLSALMEITTARDKDENSKPHGDRIKDESSRKPMKSFMSTSKSGSKARTEAAAKAVAITEDEIMVKNLEKKKRLFDHGVDFHQSQVGFSENRDDHNMKESSCYPVEFSNTYHFLKHLHLDNTVRNTTDIYMENITEMPSANHSIFDYNNNNNNIADQPPTACWLNSRTPLLGFSNNVGPLNGNMINRENHSSGMISTNFMNFNSENQGQ
ncbi:hypothetical protein R6Q59_012221 [Mikania micrantha]